LDRGSVRDWKYVVVHHSASDSGSAAEFDKYHREQRGWENGLGYHFVIGNGSGSHDGKIEIGNRWKRQIDGAHAGVKKYNHYGIGICLVGNFNKTYPTQAQMSSLSVVVYTRHHCPGTISPKSLATVSKLPSRPVNVAALALRPK